MAKIEFRNVTKCFPRKPGQKWLKSALSEMAKRDGSRFNALSDVSFSIDDGESVALVGRNGAGKSTVLNLIAGLMVASSGSIDVEGRTAALLDLGAGFHADLTGRENLVINSALLGLSRQEVRRRADAMIEFSGLGDFIDQPLRTYSSGMSLRLAFSVAVSVDPDILLIDEVLAVGDAAFQARSIKRINELKQSGKIFICVTHSMAIEDLCEKAIWLDQGRVRKAGPIREVLQAYAVSLSGNVEIRQEETPVIPIVAGTRQQASQREPRTRRG